MFRDGSFPGYPGPVDPKRGLGGVAYPAMPSMPIRPHYPVTPGGQPSSFPMHGTPANPMGMPVAAGPLAGLQAYGVPVGYTPAGWPMLQTAMANAAGFQLPPNVPGMPQIPGPPEGLFNGGMGAGALFQPVAPVTPFDQGDQVRQLQA